MSAQTTKTAIFRPSRQSGGTANKESALPPAPECSICLGHNGTAPLTNGLKPKDIDDGLMAWLPQKISEQSCAHQGLNDTASNHPCVIIKTSKCGHLLFCLQITSFGDGIIQDKYSLCFDEIYKAKIFDDYVAFQESTTIAHNQLGMLDYRGPQMDKQSYAHLEFGFWIEWQNLQEWDSRRNLKRHSLSMIRDLYEAAEARRQVLGVSESTIKLARADQKRKRSQPSAGSIPIVAEDSDDQSESEQPAAKRIISPKGVPSNVSTFTDTTNDQRNWRPSIRLPQRAPQWSHSLPRLPKRENAGPSESKHQAMQRNWRRSDN